MDIEACQKLADGRYRLNLDVTIYSREAIVKTAYLFTNKCHINFHSYSDKTAIIDFSPKNEDGCLKTMLQDFLNELLDQQLRVYIHNETKNINEMIVREAFAPLESVDVKEPNGQKV